MLERTMTRTRDRGLALTAVTLGLAVVAAAGYRLEAQERPGPAPAEAAVWVTEVDVDAETGETHLLLSAGRDGGVDRGDVVEVERDGKKLAQATVVSSYADMAVANVAKDAVGRVARGDWVKVKPKGKRAARPADGPIQVTGVGEGTITVSAGTARGLRKGQEATLLRDGKPIGRVRVETVENDKATIVIVEGDSAPAVGDGLTVTPAAHEGHEAAPKGDLTRDEIRRLEKAAEKNPKYDFVGTGFLGVVAEIEHPTPVAASCHVGVLVRRIVQGSPAETAKIRAGDRVIAIDDRVVRTPAEIHRGIKRRTADVVRVTIVRDDVLHVVNADFTRR
jgi:hypothetical protein